MKKRILTVLIAIITVIPLVLITPKADDPLTPVTKDYVITSYGNYYVECSTVPSGASLTVGDSSSMGVQFSMPVGTGGCSVTFVYNFESERSGTMRLNLTLPLSVTLKSCSFAITGGRFTNMTSITTQGTNKIFDVKFQDTKGIAFTLFLPANNTNFDSILHPITLSNISIQDGVGLFDIDATLDSIYSSLDLYLPGMSTNLSNIASNTSTMASDIATLKSYLDGVEGGLDLLNQALYDLRVPIDSIYLNWNTAVSGGTTGYVSNSSDPNLYIYKTDLGGITVSRTDARFSSYDVINGNYIILKWFFDLNGTGTASQYYDFNNIRLQWRDPAGNLNNLNIFTGDSLSFAKFVEYNTTRNSYILTIYCPASCFIGSNSSVTFYDFAVDQFTLENVQGIGFMFGGMSDTLPYDSQYLSLLESINNGIGALNDDYDTSTYDNYEQTLDGLNDGLRGRFDNVDNNMQTNVDTLFTPSGTAGSDGSVFEKFHFNAVNTFMSGFINRIFTSFPAFKYILIFALLLLVIGVMI